MLSQKENFFTKHPTLVLAGALLVLVVSIGILPNCSGPSGEQEAKPDTAPAPPAADTAPEAQPAPQQATAPPDTATPAPQQATAPPDTATPPPQQAAAPPAPEAALPVSLDAAVSATAEPPATDRMGTVTADILNIRSGPSVSDPVVAKMNQGTKLRILESLEGGWHKVKTDTGVEGWAHPDYLQAAAPAAPAALGGASEAYLNVVGTIPLQGDILTNQIVVFFDDAIVPPVQSDGTPVLAQPFTTKPALSGQFRVGRNFVALAKTAFERQTLYQIELNENIQSVSGKKLNPQQRTFTFSTYVLFPDSLWWLEDKAERTVLAILFPGRVTLEALKEHLQVKAADGKTVPVQVEDGRRAGIFRLTLEPVSQWPVTVTVTKGLPDATGTLVQPEDRVLTYPVETALTITSANWNQAEPKKIIVYIGFSHKVDSDALKRYLTITDTSKKGAAVPFGMRLLGVSPHHSVTLTVDDPESMDLSLNIAKGLPGAARRSLQADYRWAIQRMRETLRVEYDSWGLEGRDDGLVLYVYMNDNVSLEDLKAHLELTPAVSGLRIEPSYSNRNFKVYGEWDSNTVYQMKLRHGLKYGVGGVVKTAIVYSTTSGRVPKYLGFGQEGKYYFPRRAGLTLPVSSRNLDKAEIVLHRMFPSNIAVALAHLNEGKGTMTFGDLWSEEISKKPIGLTLRQDRLVDTPLDLDPLFPKDKKGVFLLQVRGPKPKPVPRPTLTRESEDGGEYYEYYDGAGYDTKVILWTNIGLLAHWQDKELALFAHDLYSLAPLPAAKVAIYSSKNQLLGQSTTNEQGLLHMKDFDPTLGTPHVAVVEYGEDYTFLELKPRADETQEFGPDMPPYGRESYDAFVYADRDLYRPGETAHLRWMVRKNYGDALGAVPLLVNVIKPNGRVLLTQPTTLSELGTGGLDLATQKAYPTGKYEVQIQVPGGDTPIGAYAFSLEEFVPNRIKAAVTVAEKQWLAGQTYDVRVNAQHLFGAPAADRKCEGKVVLQRRKLATERWRDYTFDNDSDYSPNPVELGEARTDENGNVVFKFSYTSPAEVTFPLKASVVGRVFELGGRGVMGKVEVPLWPSPIALGVSAAPAEGGQGIQVYAAAINPDETPAALAKVNVTLEKQVWNYYVRRYYSNYEPRWSESFEPVETREVALTAGKGSITFKMSDYGYYRVRVHSEATKQYSTLSFYSYGGRCNLVDAARPSLIKVTLNKPVFAIGEEAELRIESPFDGKGIIVIQGESIEEMIPIDITNNIGILKVPVKAEHFPNVWLEANVVHAIQEGRKQVYPFSSSAVANLRVRDPRRQLAITFPNLPQEIRPATTATFEVDVRDAAGGTAAQAELTLAVVDEGIHSITNYKNPAPYEWVSRPRKPDYRRAHYYDKVAYDFEKSPIGGDSELALRIGAAQESWIKPVALWSGVVQTDANGKATVTMDLPEFTGQLRIVAVGCTGTALGSHGANFFVRRPYMLQTSLPRYLLPGDAFHSRAVFYNHSDAPCKAKISWTPSGTLQQGAGSKEIEVKARGEAAVDANFVARAALGPGEIRWEAVVTGADGKELERLTEVMPIPVLSPAGYQTAHETIILKPGEGREIRNTKFLEDDRVSLAITAGANPILRLQKALEYVIGYPYGCVEQITSRLMPMYLLRQNTVMPETETMKNVGKLDHYIQAGISRLFAMQTASGGLGFWPGASQPAEYSSVYALHFLTLVKRGREYELPEPSFQALQDYVRTLAMNSSRDTQSDLYTRSYALYVLALDGDIKAIQQIERFNEVVLPRPARYLLAAALAQNTKDLDRVKMYLSKSPLEAYTLSEPDEALSSDIRNTAVELLALQQMGGDPIELLKLANTLIAFLEQRHYGNTQETAFIITALSGYMAAISANLDTAAAAIVVGDKREEIRGGALYQGAQAGPGRVFAVSNTGQTDLYLNVTSKGVPEKLETAAISEGGITVMRALYTNRGAPFDARVYKQTDSYVVALEIANTRYLRNVIVSDLLPAGFEIENPRLNEEMLTGETFKGAAQPSFLEIRDDRLVIAFDTLQPQTHRFYYVIRAVTPGKYTHPPAYAECMYDERVRARSEVAEIEVKP